MNKTHLGKLLENPEFARKYDEEGFTFLLLERICEFMQENEITKETLFRSLYTKNGIWVTEFFQGKNNKIQDFVFVIHSLDADIDFKITKKENKK